jgi:steroid delta-isomerase-like uncharacterized protein
MGIFTSLKKGGLSMSTEQNTVRAVRSYFEDLWNKGNLAVADEIISPNIVVHDAFAPPGAYGSGASGFAQFVGGFRSAFPDVYLTMDDEIIEGDKVVVRWTMRGTQQGPLGNIPSTGRQINVAGVDIFRIADDKIAEWWIFFDAVVMLHQLGVFPPP